MAVHRSLKMNKCITMVNKIDLISDEEFAELVQNSSSVADVLKKLNYSVKGNSWGYPIVQERMKNLNITFGQKLDSQQFCKNAGFSNQPLSLQEVLTKDSSYCRTKLKQRLVSEGLKEYKCECCGISTWLGKKISLQLHHINGINNDNRLSNLQLLCPNCHSQTENFPTKGKGRVIERKCQNLPLEDKKLILETVREVGIVEARKKLSYRNSLINAVVKHSRDILVTTCPDGTKKEFSTVMEIAEFIIKNENLKTSVETLRSAISRCLSSKNKQKSSHGYTFVRRSIVG